MSTIAFAAIIRVCSPASVSFPNAIAANSFVASGKYLRASALVCATPSAGSSVDGMGTVGLRSSGAACFAIKTSAKT
jgi:hypothetical protein